MEYNCLTATSNVGPWWQKAAVPATTTCQRNSNGAIGSRGACLEQLSCVREPILSVQQKRLVKDELPHFITCKPSYSDKCYKEYNVHSLRHGFGQLKDVRSETVEPGKPSLVVHSMALDRSDDQIFIFTERVVSEVNKAESRKRFAIAHMDKYIYVIGGYIFDHQTPARTKPPHDYKYDLRENRLISIPALPNAAIGFGLCVDENRIFTIGGNDLSNQPLTECYYLQAAGTADRWVKLPDLPAPTSGAGAAVFEDELHCIGGYDVLGNEFIAHGEYLILRLAEDQQWRYGPEIRYARARPLVFITPSSSKTSANVYIAGGFNVDARIRAPYLVPDVQLFDNDTRRWQRVTSIPDLQINHELSFSQNKLHVSETFQNAFVWITEKEDEAKKKNNNNISNTKVPEQNSPASPSPSPAKAKQVTNTSEPSHVKSGQVVTSPAKARPVQQTRTTSKSAQRSPSPAAPKASKSTAARK